MTGHVLPPPGPDNSPLYRAWTSARHALTTEHRKLRELIEVREARFPVGVVRAATLQYADAEDATNRAAHDLFETYHDSAQQTHTESMKAIV